MGVGAGAARDINIFHGVGHIRGFSAMLRWRRGGYVCVRCQLWVRNVIPTLKFDYVGVRTGAARDINIFHGVGHIRGFSAMLRWRRGDSGGRVHSGVLRYTSARGCGVGLRVWRAA